MMDQITENLWVGDIQDVCEGDTSRFDRVITTCQDNVEDNVECSYNHFNMSDGPSDSYKRGRCSYKMLHEAAVTLLGSLTYGEDVLIHCHMGQSRSVSVACAVLGVKEGLEYNEALELIQESRPQAEPNPHFRSHVETFVENYSP